MEELGQTTIVFTPLLLPLSPIQPRLLTLAVEVWSALVNLVQPVSMEEENQPRVTTIVVPQVTVVLQLTNPLPLPPLPQQLPPLVLKKGAHTKTVFLVVPLLLK
jgi:hypothetical protein